MWQNFGSTSATRMHGSTRRKRRARRYCRIPSPRMPHMVSILAAPVFVFLWSTGFIVARAITPYVDPNLYLLARFGGTTLLFLAIAAATRAPWPRGREIG